MIRLMPRNAPAEAALPASYPGFFSSARSFSLPPGRSSAPDGVRGYYIDLRVKAEARSGRTPSLGRLEDRLWVRVHQWGLGAYERYLAGEGEQWLQNAVDVGEYALSQQVEGGPHDGLWLNRLPYTKTFQLAAGWPSAMAQGEGASLLTRLHLETGDERYADGGPARGAGDGAAERRGRRAGGSSTGAVARGVPDGSALLRAQRRHLRALGALRRRRGRCTTRTRRARSTGRRHAGAQPAPLGHRLLVALRPVPPPRVERRKLLLSRASHEPARGDERDRSAAGVRRGRRSLRALCAIAD